MAGGAETDICFSLQKQNLLPCSIPLAWKRDDYRFLRENLNFAVSAVIRKQAAETPIDEKNIEFLTTVTSGALISIVEKWLCGEITWDADEIVQNISYVAEDLTAGAKLRYEQKVKEIY